MNCRIFNCPKCGLDWRESPSGFIFSSSKTCPELMGTKYVRPNEIASPGPQWCPHLSDGAPEDIMMLPAGYRKEVEAAIAAAKAKTMP